MPAQKTRNPSITRELLMEQETLGLYLTFKLDQLGISDQVAGKAMGYSNGNTIANLKRKKPDAKGFHDDKLEALIDLFKQRHLEYSMQPLDDEEIAHIKKLNDCLPKPKIQHAKTVETEAGEKSYAPESLLTGLGELDKKSGHYSNIDGNDHIVPTEAMLRALSTKDAEAWNQLKAELLKDDEEADLDIYLRGFDAGMCDLTGFDLSGCDLVAFRWPKRLECCVPTSLLNATLVLAGPNADSDYFHKIPMKTRTAYEAENPGFNIDKLIKAPVAKPVPTVLSMPKPTPAATSATGSTPDDQDADKGPKAKPPLEAIRPIFEYSPDMDLRSFVNAALASLQEQLPGQKINQTWLANEMIVSGVSVIMAKGVKRKRTVLDRMAAALNLTPEYREALYRANEVTLRNVDNPQTANPTTPSLPEPTEPTFGPENETEANSSGASAGEPTSTPLPADIVPDFEFNPDMNLRAFIAAARESIQKQEPKPRKTVGWLAQQTGLYSIDGILQNGVKARDPLDRIAAVLNFTAEQHEGLYQANDVTRGNVASKSEPEPDPEDLTDEITGAQELSEPSFEDLRARRIVPLPDHISPGFELSPEMDLRSFINAALESLHEQEPSPRKSQFWLTEQLGLSTIQVMLTNGIQNKAEKRLGELSTVLNLTPEYREALRRANNVTLGISEEEAKQTPTGTVGGCTEADSFESVTMRALRDIGKDMAWLAGEMGIDEAELSAHLRNGISDFSTTNKMIQALGIPAADQDTIRQANKIALEPEGRRMA